MLVLLKSALDALEAVRQHPADERVVPILLSGRAQHRNAVDAMAAGPSGMELMSFEVGKRAMDFLIENSGTRRNLEVDFFGGEPPKKSTSTALWSAHTHPSSRVILLICFAVIVTLSVFRISTSAALEIPVT